MRSAAFILALLVVAGGTPLSAVGAPPTDGSATPHALPADDARFSVASPNETRIVVTLHDDRNARWTITMRYRLDDANETAAFRQYATAFEAGNADAGLDVEMFRTIVARSSEATGRNMSLTDAAYNASVDGDTGTLRLSFTWTNFLVRTGERTLQFDDTVLLPHNRTWLSSLHAGQTMVIETPPGYSVSDSPFGVENNSVVIEGPRRFDGGIKISYQKDAAVQRTPWGLIVAGLVAAAGLVAGAILVRRRRLAAAGDDEEDVVSVTTVDAPPPEPDAEPSNGTVDDGEAAGESHSAEVDVELLSDEERVERLLDRNGGRMKQASIVQRTGWSDAKVSQLLSSMAESGRIDKLRLGRENLISLPDSEEE